MTTLTYPYTLTAGAPENVNQLNSNLAAISSVINGGITNGNLSGSAAITDANLASPNNSVWRTVATAASLTYNGLGTSYYFISSGATATPTTSGADNSVGSFVYPAVVDLRSADFSVAGLTTYVRIKSVFHSNATALGYNLETGIASFTVGGGTGAIKWTIGSSAASATFTTPSASTATVANGTAVALPSDGVYAFYMKPSGSAPSNHLAGVQVSLQVRHA